jgi:hypothetical protein
MTVIPATPITHVTPCAAPPGTVHTCVRHTTQRTATSAGTSHRPRSRNRYTNHAVQQLNPATTATVVPNEGDDSTTRVNRLDTNPTTNRNPSEYRTPARSNSRSVLPATGQC